MENLRAIWPFGGRAIDQVQPKDLHDLLLKILPTFIAIVGRARNNLPLPDHSLSDEAFLTNFEAAVYSLNVVLKAWDAIESIERLPKDEADIRNNLKRVLHQLEDCFMSRKKMPRSTLQDLGFECREETYPKLRALSRAKQKEDAREKLDQSNGIEDESAHDALHERFLTNVGRIMRINTMDSRKQGDLLDNLSRAQDFFFYKLPPSNSLPSKSGPDEKCPISLSEYPLKHVRKLMQTLSDVLQGNWCSSCGCTPSSVFHDSRKTRLNLTQHQRFKSVFTPEEKLEEKVSFRILFPTSSRDFQWQDTDITVTNFEYVPTWMTFDFEVPSAANQPVKSYVVNEPREVKNGVCGIIRGVKPRLRPRMIVYEQKLWQQVAVDFERNHLSSTQLLDSDFASLKDLLLPCRGRRQSFLSSIKTEDRLILSLVLTTSLLHFFGGPWLQASLSSENICFLVSGRLSTDITKPYLTTTCSTVMPKPVAVIEPDRLHRFPDILSLGILLLEIAQGAAIDFDKSQDRCVEANFCLEKWTNESMGRFTTIDERLLEVISACIEPENFSGNVFDQMKVPNFLVREYIFERILWPLDRAMNEAYEKAPANETKGFGNFDHQDEHAAEKQQSADSWYDCLDGVHSLIFQSLKQCRKERKRANRVKIAVLDTGLQIPRKQLQVAYEGEGRIDREHSQSFVPITEGEEAICWDKDCDGHGSRVGEIILRVAPEAVLHVAKVFRHRNDLKNQKTAGRVHQRIAEALERATSDWKVDIIVMCFGFDEPIPSISKAIEKASKIEEPPLFFAATRNDGANKRMAWPAKDSRVFGVSSTDGYGAKSNFNPREARVTGHPILYAFGEGVPVSTAEPATKNYVSGTSYATPVAAALVANLVGCIRMIIATSADGATGYLRVPERLRKMPAMVAILEEHMENEHDNGDRSLLPWNFLNINNHRILESVDKTLGDILGNE